MSAIFKTFLFSLKRAVFDFNNYISILLLLVLSKLVETVLSKVIWTFIERNSLLLSSQHEYSAIILTQTAGMQLF